MRVLNSCRAGRESRYGFQVEEGRRDSYIIMRMRGFQSLRADQSSEGRREGRREVEVVRRRGRGIVKRRVSGWVEWSRVERSGLMACLDGARKRGEGVTCMVVVVSIPAPMPGMEATLSEG